MKIHRTTIIFELTVINEKWLCSMNCNNNVLKEAFRSIQSDYHIFLYFLAFFYIALIFNNLSGVKISFFLEFSLSSAYEQKDQRRQEKKIYWQKN
jgi:hypothetical protein